MPSELTEASRRGLIITTVALVLVLVVADLLRPNSLIREVWSDLFSSRSYLRGFFQNIREGGPGSVLQR